MGDLFLLSEREMSRISPRFPLAHGVTRVDDCRVMSGIVYAVRNGLQWGRCPQEVRSAQDTVQPLHPLEAAQGLRPPLCQPRRQGSKPERIMIDATHRPDLSPQIRRPLESWRKLIPEGLICQTALATIPPALPLPRATASQSRRAIRSISRR